MREIMEYWQVIATVVGLVVAWVTGVIVATARIMNWITQKFEVADKLIASKFESVAAKLEMQDAKRIEVKEAILVEVRDRSHTLQSRMDMQHVMTDQKIDNLKDKIAEEVGELSNRVTRLEAHIENDRRDAKKMVAGQ